MVFFRSKTSTASENSTTKIALNLIVMKDHFGAFTITDDILSSKDVFDFLNAFVNYKFAEDPNSAPIAPVKDNGPKNRTRNISKLSSNNSQG